MDSSRRRIPLQVHQGQLSQALGNRTVAAARQLQPQVAQADRPALALQLHARGHHVHRRDPFSTESLMQVASKSSNPGIRVVLHISPSVYVSGILSAQRRGQKLNEFLDSAITKASSSDPDDPAHKLPWSPHAVALFLQVADTTPEALRGPWKVLYAKVLDDPTLWLAPQATVGDFEAGLATDGWRINEAALIKAWPRLVSSTFAC